MGQIENIRQVKINELTPYEKNAKLHSESQVKKIVASIEEFGFLNPILIDKDNNIIAGHGRVMAAKQIGMEEVPAIAVEGLTDEQRRAYILADNKLTELGEWDADLVSEELKDLKEAGFEIELTGFNIDDIIFTDDMDAEDIDEEELEKQVENAEPRIKRGEIWQLGKHRLMCGDSTSADDLDRLLDGELMDLVLTDPPYNVAIGITDIEDAKRRKRRTDGLSIDNDAMSDEEFFDFLKAVFNNMKTALKEGGVFYIWHADNKRREFLQAIDAVDLEVRQILIWVKDRLVLGRQDYQWRHEPCIYGWKEGAGHYFIDCRTLTTVFDNLESLTREKAIEIIKELSYFSTAIYEDRPATSEFHPTMKPIGLFMKQIRNSSREGEAVLDLFGGSGTTLLACEKLDRRCFMMEYAPNYAEVIIQRWEAETGEKAVKIS